MSAHRVVGQLQRRREVIHSLIPAPQQLENLSPSAFQDSFAPSGMFHDRNIKARLNKSKKALTNIAEMTGPYFAAPTARKEKITTSCTMWMRNAQADPRVSIMLFAQIHPANPA